MKNIPTCELSQRWELMALSGVQIVGKEVVEEKAGEVGLDRQGSVIYVKGAGLDSGHCRGPLKGNAVIHPVCISER